LKTYFWILREQCADGLHSTCVQIMATQIYQSSNNSAFPTMAKKAFG